MAIAWAAPSTALAAAPEPGPPPKPGACSPGPKIPNYFLSTQVDTTALLPPPPAPDSPTQQADLQAVLEAQRAARLAGTTQHAVDDALLSCGRIGDVLGEPLVSKPAVDALVFLTRAALEAASATTPAKRYWKRSRPYAVSADVQRLADVAPDAKEPTDDEVIARMMAAADGAGQRGATGNVDANAATPATAPGNAEGGVAGDANKCAAGALDAANPAEPAPAKTHHLGAKAQRAADAKAKAEKDKAEQRRARASYPSGHAAFAAACAIMLADIVPEKRAELFARSRDYGQSRLIVGAHFPDDIEAGRMAGTIATAIMMQNAKFERDFAGARASMRAALNLPAEPPDLAPDKDKARGN